MTYLQSHNQSFINLGLLIPMGIASSPGLCYLQEGGTTMVPEEALCHQHQSTPICSIKRAAQEWGVISWHPHPFFASVGLSQPAGCPSCCVQLPATYLFSATSQVHFLCSLIKSTLDVQKLYLHKLTTWKEGRDRVICPKSCHTPPCHTVQAPQICICLVNFVLLKKKSSFR